MERKQTLTLTPGAEYRGGITIKSPTELIAMREAGRVVAATIQVLVSSLEPGMKTKKLDAIASREIRRLGAAPAFKGYRGFPATICVSLNQEIVHGIPGERIIREGDIVSIDVGAVVDGFYADAAVTAPMGKVSPEGERLIETTRQSLEMGIRQAVVGNRVGDISVAVQRFAEGRGYGVVREYVGHGVGRALHEEPSIPNFGEPGKGPLLRPGMVIAIEPMLNVGGWQTRVLEDEWTVVTADGTLSAHFEHTIAITEEGPQVLTSLNGS
ncbi:MAG: type I methionyl aminopeptidase [Dehalococcoidia bacterium]|nr:type I methionyl aminopeptidase [Dehalococcoidia bacterium]